MIGIVKLNGNYMHKLSQSKEFHRCCIYLDRINNNDLKYLNLENNVDV